MDYCKKCKNFGCNAAGTERTTTDCEDYMSHLPTNADRIRSMSDEEMAEWRSNGQCPPDHYYGDFDCSIRSCKDCWLDWLRKEVTD